MKRTIALATILVCYGLIFQHCTNKKEQIMKSNKVTWFSIPSDNLDKSTEFYNKVFGWKIEPLTEESNHDFDFHVMVNSESDENYISTDRGAVNGCIVKRKIGLPTPAVLVEVDDLDEAIKKVKAAGGTVVTEKIVMKSLNGIFVLIRDLDGNYVELFESRG